MDFDTSFNYLKKYCEDESFMGWDPFDGLNSKYFQKTPMKDWRLFRLMWIQFFKRNPLNLRKIFKVPKDYNPKGVALFLSGYCKLHSLYPEDDNLKDINFLSEKLLELQSRGYSGPCWGYNFDWQSRVFFQPKYTPMVVVTSFAANALFDAYEVTGNIKYLNAALNAGEFIVNNLNRWTNDDGFIFSYSPLDHSRIYNASLLGARLLARGYFYNKNKNYLQLSRSAVKTIIAKQDINGSWVYGDAKSQQWIDSFHTGFNLECINDYMNYSGDDSFINELNLGLNYYLENFFLDDGTPKYYNNKIYPLDIHAPAQFIVTIIKLNRHEEYRSQVEKVLAWTIKNMQSKEGYFFYQIKRILSSKIPYMRWSQAWMFYAFCEYFNAVKK